MSCTHAFLAMRKQAGHVSFSFVFWGKVRTKLSPRLHVRLFVWLCVIACGACQLCALYNIHEVKNKKPFFTSGLHDFPFILNFFKKQYIRVSKNSKNKSGRSQYCILQLCIRNYFYSGLCKKENFWQNITIFWVHYSYTQIYKLTFFA